MSFDACVDAGYPAETSIVLRYRRAFTFGDAEHDSRFKEALERTSIREGSRIFPLLEYKGVEIHLLDETSLMHTRTLKSIDGCVTTAHCVLAGYRTVVFETGGNTGTALTAYGTNAGLETFCFLPEENLPLLNSRVFSSPKAHLISVEEPGRVKEAAHSFEAKCGFPHIPETPWRYEASRFRGMFILEQMLEKTRFDWIAQTISAAFGPIGIYWAFRNLGQGLGRPPRFLGVQQKANCPMYRSWKAHRTDLKPIKVESTSKLLTPVMYDIKPHTYGTYRDLMEVLQEAEGELTTVSNHEFDRLLHRRFDGLGIRDHLGRHGIEIGEPVVEKTGLIALAGTLKAIDKGEIANGARVLCCLTSGVSEADGRAEPELRIRSLSSLIAEYGEKISSRGRHG